MCSAVCRCLPLHGRSRALGFGHVRLAATEVLSTQTSNPRNGAFGTIAVVEEFAEHSCDRCRATTSDVTQFLFGGVVAPPARVAVP
jgi:hypothetical protein